MSPCSFRSTFVTALLFTAATAVIAASALTVEVRASRGIALEVIDARTPADLRARVHERFARALGAALTRRGQPPVPVHARELPAGAARAGFERGECDALLVLADDRPRGLRRFNAVTLCGELDAAGREPIYLIVGNDDPARREALTRAFTAVLADRENLKAIALADDATRFALAGDR